MVDPIKMLEQLVAAALAQESMSSPERIREIIASLRNTALVGAISDESAEALARLFEQKLGVTMKVGSYLVDIEGYEEWFDAAKSNITPYYWDRYKQHLQNEMEIPTPVVTTLDIDTDLITSLLENPLKQGEWERRGMVVGNVQSGKTANYTGLICKAADAGYKLIVVIAGVNNLLRNQTQKRIDEGFVGRDSARLLSKREDMFIGVGRYDNTRRPITFTNTIKDFDKGMATGLGLSLNDINEPAVFVIKKNKNTLENLIEWLKGNSTQGRSQTIDAPMLLIDDEADNASINTQYSRDQVSKINEQIRQLLNLFERSSYVAYTATPFANIFIDPDTADNKLGHDLFPKNFIYSLEPPSSYLGPTKMFLEAPNDYIRQIDDNEETLPRKHTIDLQVPILPKSLIDAIRTFILARATRLARGDVGHHSSMLVNCSRFTKVQGQIRNRIHEKLDEMKSSIRVNGALPPEGALKDPEIEALHRIWQEDFGATEGEWPTIQKLLIDAVTPVGVVEINGTSPGNLNYQDHSKAGLNIIAVGGFSLSRGLTLEGLIVSYILRNSEMYDTLMQMARWCGYRTNYEDLCRVWMEDEIQGWYQHIAEAIEELRIDLRSMMAAGGTPENFGLKVRTHPANLIITARNKFGSSTTQVMEVGLSTRFVETSILKGDTPTLEANRNAVHTLAETLGNKGMPLEKSAVAIPNGWHLPDAPIEPVLQFLRDFKNHDELSAITNTGPIIQYINDRYDELENWDILFASLKESETGSLMDDSLGIPIICQRRASGKSTTPDGKTIYITNNRRVGSRGVEKVGLPVEEVKNTEAAYKERSESEKGQSLNIPDHIFRSLRVRPLLIIHLLQIAPQLGAEGFSLPAPVVAWSIGFPKSGKEERRSEYRVDSTLQRQLWPDPEDWEIGGDDDD